MEALILSVASQFGTMSLVNLLTPLALPTLDGRVAFPHWSMALAASR